jgi:alpha-N-acetylglucosamine transferase
MDPFALPRIDEVVDSTASYELLSFLDCYSSYHQISLREEDQIKTSFITPFGTYCYTTMSFGLKKFLKDQIRDQLIEAYVDDVVVKTKVASSLVNDLDQTFKALNAF